MVMREIKFRLWLDGEIVGFEKHDTNHVAACTAIMHSEDGRKWVNINFGGYIKHCGKDQFTGLTDRRGRDIYDGDIVEHTWPRQVFWDDGGWSVKKGNCFTAETARNYNTIGNIRQNPELIQQP